MTSCVPLGGRTPRCAGRRPPAPPGPSRPPPTDHGFLATDVVDEPVGRHPDQIAGVEPSVSERGCGRLGVSEVAVHDPSPANDHFAGLLPSERTVLVVHDADLAVRVGTTD